MRRLLGVLAAILLLAVPARAQDEADRAWAAGDVAAAMPLYEARLRADSADVTALHRVALARAWAERYDEALALLDRLLRVDPRNREAQVDRARVLAWRGDPAGAATALDPLLAADPGYLPALQARAQFESWAGAYDEALATYGRIAEITPGDRTVGLDRARVLAWASRFASAGAAYDSLLAENPRDVQALLGLAQVLSWAARLDSAETVYRRVLELEPTNREAARGLARSAAWGGRLVPAERRWRDVLARDPNDAAAWVGLSQTLRWQGRDAASLDAARRAVRIAPTDRDAREALRWAEMAVVPRVSGAAVYETDSDRNRIRTASATAAFRPTARVELRADAYLRESELDGGGFADVASGTLGTTGAAVTLWTQLEPGWSLSGTVGASDLEGADGLIPTVRASVATPGRYPVTGGVAYSHAALDATMLLIARQVYVDEVSASLGWAPAQGWTVSGGAGGARFTGRVSGETNERWNGSLAIARRVSAPFTVGIGLRAFGFSEDGSDPYFDPDFYGLAELTARWLRETRHWSVSLEGAPGVQQIRSDGDPGGAVRGAASVAYVLSPGRRIVLSGTFANSGLTQIAGNGADYRYRALSLAGAWAF